MTTKELVKKYGYKKRVDENGRRYIIVPMVVTKEFALRIANTYFREAYSDLEIKIVYSTRRGKKVYPCKKFFVIGEFGWWGICRKVQHNYE